MRRGRRLRSPRVLVLLLTGALALSATGSVAAVGALHLLRPLAQAARSPAARSPAAGSASGSAADQRRDADVRAALATMNTALAGHDEAMFASVVLPGSSAFAHRQHAVYRSLARVPFRQVRYASGSASSSAALGGTSAATPMLRRCWSAAASASRGASARSASPAPGTSW